MEHKLKAGIVCAVVSIANVAVVLTHTFHISEHLVPVSIWFVFEEYMVVSVCVCAYLYLSICVSLSVP